MRIVTAEEYRDLPSVELAWTIHKLIPRPGLVLLHGPEKVGKSFLAFQIALAVARGEDFMGQKGNQGSVLYLQFDTSKSIWQERLRELTESGENISGPILMIHPEDQPPAINILNQDGQAWVRETLRLAKPLLVIIDVLRELHSLDENVSRDMKQVGDVIMTLFAGLSVLLIHHSRKIPAEVTEPGAVLYSRGSSYITGKVDAIWMLTKGRLKIVPRFDEETTWTVHQQDNGFWTFPDTYYRADLLKKLFDLCLEFPTSTHNELSLIARERLNISRATYYRHLAGRTCPHQQSA